MAGINLNRTLITGALGFVGGELSHSLIGEGREVTLLVRAERLNEARERFSKAYEVITLEDMIDQPQKRIFDSIFHLATVYIYENTIQDIPKLIEGNIYLPTTLADIATRWGTKVSFINVSTFMQHFQGNEYAPTCLYAATKKSIEDILLYYSFNFKNFEISHLVFPHIYGEGDTRVKLLNLLVNATNTRSSLQLSSGRQLLDLVHVSDAVAALKSSEAIGSGRWSIGSDVCYSIRELTEMISEISRFQLDVNFDERKDRKFDTFEEWHTAERLPGWTPKVTLREWITSQLTVAKEIN